MSIIQWSDMCEAAGITTRNLDPLTCCLMAGKIIHDSVVTERKKKFLVGSILPTGSVIRVLQEMTDSERQLLRLRVTQG
jgi:hypothetical protein